MGNLGPTELIIIGVIIVLLFGASRLPATAKGLGQALRLFKKEIKDEDTDAPQVQQAPVQQVPVQQLPVQQQAPVQQVPVQQQAPVQQAPVQQAPVEQPKSAVTPGNQG
jgi:sec-independent protein translocase protein TatA